MMVGGYGFLLMFYLAGLESVPRRYASYASIRISSVMEFGQMSAGIAAVCVAVFVVGMLMYYTTVLGSFGKWSARIRTGT